MQKNGLLSRVFGLLVYSPFFLLVFLIVPAYIVLGLKLHYKVSGDMLLYNNVAFLACLLVRVVVYLMNLNKPVRYCAERGVPGQEVAIERSADAVRGELSKAGFRFAADGRYGEKRDLGYLGTIFLYIGIFLLLATGSYDYLREYSIMVRLGVGEPMPLNGKGLVGQFEAGNFAGTESLPKLRVVRQILPNAQYPQGATEISLVGADDKVLKTGTVSPGKPMSYGGLDFHMIKFTFDAMIHLGTGPYALYDGFIKFLPLAQKKGEYSYYARFSDQETHKLKAEAWLKPEDKQMLIEANYNGKKLYKNTLNLWGVNTKPDGEYTGAFQGLAHWSELRVARGRHTSLLGVGALLGIVGLLARLLFRPQRVWIEEAGSACRLRSRGNAGRLVAGN